ncbi:MAG: radical SAM protein, partial [Candidatus Methanofastidiosa archaeon]|nr:radical SAM protein [Candidatus Methanofastidiosa archaeon]
MSISHSFKKNVLTKTVMWAVNYLQKDPEKNFKKAVNTLYKLSESFNFLPVFKNQMNALKSIAEKELPGKKLVVNLLKDTDSDVLKKLVLNFLINAAWVSVPLQREITRRDGFNVPWFLLIDPTENCNYNCIGCWAGSYKQYKQMSFETFDRILREAKELGIYFIVVSGGEPTLYPHLFEIFKKHNDMAFMFYTNGSMINEDYAQKLKEVSNAVPCISVEGFEEKTDWRRGKGAWSRVMIAMNNLKKAGVP